VRQRLCAIAQGYEDNNDAATLAKDPASRIMAGKAPESGADPASEPTLSRFENRVTTKGLRRLSDGLLELYLKTHPGPRKAAGSPLRHRLHHQQPVLSKDRNAAGQGFNSGTRKLE
jgi:hypothetical protein